MLDLVAIEMPIAAPNAGRDFLYVLRIVLIGLAGLTASTLIAAFLIGKRSKTATLKQHVPVPIVVIFMLGMGLTALFDQATIRNLNKYDLLVKYEISWMNAWLPKDAVILTMENRLFTLKRRFVAADDHRLEAFYEAETTERELEELRRLGITHIYLNEFNWNFGPLLKKRKGLFSLDPLSPHFERIDNLANRAILEIRKPPITTP